MLTIRWWFDAEPARQHDKHAQQQQIDEQNKIVQQAIYPSESESIVRHAREKEDGRHERLGQQRLNLGEEAHGSTLGDLNRFINGKLLLRECLNRWLKPMVQQGRGEREPGAYGPRCVEGLREVRTRLAVGFSSP